MNVQYLYKIPTRTYTSKITSCINCPLCYDMIGCMLYDDTEDRIRISEKSIPDKCPLQYIGVKEVEA